MLGVSRRSLQGKPGRLNTISRDGGPFVSKKRLIQGFGWTRSLIARFLGDADRQTRNKYNGSRKTALYHIDRIERVQITEEFLTAFREANKRRLATVKAIETKKQRIDANPAHVQLFDQEVLVKKACGYFYESVKDDARYFVEEPISPEQCEPDFLDFIVGFYVRYELTTFQIAAGSLKRKPIDWLQADQKTKKKALHEIARVYPWLSHECKRQLEPGHRWIVNQDPSGEIFLGS